jgi:hypothetical protein
VRRNDNLELNVPFRSEDLGEDVHAPIFLNYTLTGETFIRTAEAEPGTFEQVRELKCSLPINANFGLGCKQMSLLATHDGNIDTQTDKPIDPNRVAVATWWLHVKPAVGDPTSADDPPTLDDCPEREVGVDAGAVESSP